MGDITTRPWGHWTVLQEYNEAAFRQVNLVQTKEKLPYTPCKVKELFVLPGQSLSWQKHRQRNELWFVREGMATVYYSSDVEGEEVHVKKIDRYQNFTLLANKWHQLVNEQDTILSVIEIQYGSNCIESDILRKPRPSTDS